MAAGEEERGLSWGLLTFSVTVEKGLRPRTGVGPGQKRSSLEPLPRCCRNYVKGYARSPFESASTAPIAALQAL